MRKSYVGGLVLLSFLAGVYAQSKNGRIKLEYEGFPLVDTTKREIKIERDTLFLSKECCFLDSAPKTVVSKRPLKKEEIDSAKIMRYKVGILKMDKDYSCDVLDGYTFTLYIDSVTIKCSNCSFCNPTKDKFEEIYLEETLKFEEWLIGKEK